LWLATTENNGGVVTQAVLRNSIRFIYDSALLAASGRTLRQKIEIWNTFLSLSLGLFPKRDHASVAGFDVSYFDHSTVRFLFREVFVRQVYRVETTNPEPSILDCGANLGMATLFFKFLYPKCRIKCFEPDPATFQLLQKNVDGNRLQNIETFNIALWNENSIIDFFYDPGKRGSLLMSTSPSRIGGPAIRVPARRLSEFIDGEVDYLKLDVEGAELRILQELTASGKLRSIRQMGIEYHHRLQGEHSAMAGILEILEQNGFEYQILAGGFPDPSISRFQDIMIYARK
jgi:FkbM family methyltransferase